MWIKIINKWGKIPKQIKNKHPLLEDVRFSKVASLSSSLALFINSVYHFWAPHLLICFLFYRLFSPTGRSLCDCISRTQIPNLISLKKHSGCHLQGKRVGSHPYMLERPEGLMVLSVRRRGPCFSPSLSHLRCPRRGSLLGVFCFPGTQHTNTTFKSGNGV